LGNLIQIPALSHLVFTISTALLKKAGLKKCSPERCTSSGVSVTAFNQEKKTFYTTMSGSARAGSSSGLSLPKWQIALAIGAPVALGKFF
jgi:hypothetical protein